MKKVIIIVFVFAVTILLANTQIIKSFSATNSNDVVNIEWETITEKNISNFEVQRLSNGTFQSIYFQNAKGTPSKYKYTDSDSFTKDAVNNLQSANVVSYRIKIVYSDNTSSTYTDEINVTRNISSIKRTLGMLKEMFK